jgi:hypothetical protein
MAAQGSWQVNYDLWKIALDAAALMLALGSFIYTFFATRARATSHQIESVRLELQAHEKSHAASIGRLKDRTAHIEAQMEHLPDKDTVHRIEVSVSDLRGEMGTIAESLKSLAHSTARIDNYLWDQKK